MMLATGRGSARGAAGSTHTAAAPVRRQWSRTARAVRAAAQSPPPAQDTARGSEAAGPGPSSTSSSAGASWGPLAALLGGGGGPQQQGPTPEVRVPLNNVGKVPIFQLLYDLYCSHGGVFRMHLGPKSFLVLSDPGAVRQVLVGAVDKYSKGILAEILEFVMGNGLLAADGEHWIARRRVVAPALQRKFVSSQVALFGAATAHGLPPLPLAAARTPRLRLQMRRLRQRMAARTPQLLLLARLLLPAPVHRSRASKGAAAVSPGGGRAIILSSSV